MNDQPVAPRTDVEDAASSPPKAQAPATRPRPAFSPANWAHQALLQMDEADALVRWASISMSSPERYHRAAQAFWAVVHLLAAERGRLEATLQADSLAPRRRASRRRAPFQRVR